jgi:hypothetical protein
LDVGYNSGWGGPAIKASLQITGLDGVPERIASDPAIYRSSMCAFIQTELLPSDTFDAIVAGDFVEHVPSNVYFRPSVSSSGCCG